MTGARRTRVSRGVWTWLRRSIPETTFAWAWRSRSGRAALPKVGDTRTGAEMDPRLDRLARLFAADPSVHVRKAFATAALTVNGKIFAMIPHGALVLKLPHVRIEQLIDAGEAERFVSGGRVLKEWASLRLPEEEWPELVQEARLFVGAMSLAGADDPQGSTPLN